MFLNKEKLALFIDGANLFATAKSLGFDIDYKRLLREFQSRGDLLRAFYYTVDIVELQPKISRDPAERAAREPASRGISCSAVQPSRAPMPAKKNSRTKFRAPRSAHRPALVSRKPSRPKSDTIVSCMGPFGINVERPRGALDGLF